MKKYYAVRYFQLMIVIAASTVSLVGGRLHDAAEAGNTEAIRSLLSQGFDIEAFHSGLTPLHLAAREGHVEAIRLLLQKKADIEGKGHDKLTPLHWKDTLKRFACCLTREPIAMRKATYGGMQGGSAIF